MSTEPQLRRFYDAFQKRDAATMAAAYHPEARFDDEVFHLRGAAEIGAMWEMLCTRGEDLVLTYEILRAGPEDGEVRWVATYTFSGTGRRVVNEIHAHLHFRDGRIVEHRDVFDFWKWSRQALGLPGLLLGWSPMLRRKVEATAAKGLASFRAQRAGSGAARA